MLDGLVKRTAMLRSAQGVGWRFCCLALAAILAAPAAVAQTSAPVLELGSIASAVEQAESGHGTNPRMWRPDPLGPQGPMQVSAAAATDVGGGNRFDETENRFLGRAYLAHLYQRFGTWGDAVAAYNWGPGHMDWWIRTGRPSDRFPAGVERYRERVLVGSSTPGPDGPGRIARRGIVHAQPRGMPAGRAPGLDAALERLYADAISASLR
jgi:hypothetical protein